MQLVRAAGQCGVFKRLRRNIFEQVVDSATRLDDNRGLRSKRRRILT